MWGANLQHVTTINRSDISNAATKLFQYNDSDLDRGLDQELLEVFIWPIASRSVVWKATPIEKTQLLLSS